jgi:hypothetical protein
LTLNPLKDVFTPVAKVLPDAQAQRSFAAISPGIQGALRHAEDRGDIVRAKEPLVSALASSGADRFSIHGLFIAPPSGFGLDRIIQGCGITIDYFVHPRP